MRFICMSLFTALFFVWSFLVLGCGGDPKKRTSTPEDRPSGALRSEEKETNDAAKEDEESVDEGQITKADLLQVLEAGPAAILGRVQTEPIFLKGRFVGFQIDAFNGEPPKVLDLRVGDVVLSINEKGVERPEDFFEVIEELKTASNLTFIVLRDETRQTLTYQIVD